MESVGGQRGQATLEYILLIAVVVMLFTAVFKNTALQNFIGPGGRLFVESAETHRAQLPTRASPWQRAKVSTIYKKATTRNPLGSCRPITDEMII